MPSRSPTWLGVWTALDVPTKRDVALAALEHEQLARAARVALARHDRVRRQSVDRWPKERFAQRFARIRPTPALAAALLTQFHLTRRRTILVPFLDFLKVPHDGGVIENVEEVPAPARSRMVAAIRRLAASHPKKHVRLFLDVLGCQSRFEVFSELAEARREALPVEYDQPAPRAAPVLDAERSPESASPPADATPPTFTTLDETLLRAVVASVAEVHGALSPEKVEDLVEEVIQLNLDRHQSYFHRGFLAVLLGRPVTLDMPEATLARRAWTACGALVGYARRGDHAAVLSLLGSRSSLLRELSAPGTGYAERATPIVFRAFSDAGRHAEAARFLKPEVVAEVGAAFAREVLDAASVLIGERREADARPLLDVLLSALPALREDPDLGDDFEVLLSRRRAHAARLRGDFEGARRLLTPQLELADPGVRADILADLGLIECGLRSLDDIRLPAEEALLPELAGQFEKGWAQFLASSDVGVGGRSHGDLCLGLAHFARGEESTAVPYLERAVASMSADPERYRLGPLAAARLALAVALAEQADLARVSYVGDLVRPVLASRARAPAYLLRRVLTALELTDPEAKLELAGATWSALGPRALPVLRETRMLRHLPDALDELAARSNRRDLGGDARAEAARVVLEESYAMRDGELGEGARSWRDRAAEAFDVLVELAAEAPARASLLALLDDPDGAWRGALDPADASGLRSALLEADGRYVDAAAALSLAFHASLDVDDEWSVERAEALLEDIRALGGDDAVASLEPRLAQARDVLARRGSGVTLNHMDASSFHGLVVVVGGNEVQSQQDAAIREEVLRHWPNANVLFERTGWVSSWGDQLKRLEGQLSQARAVVVMRFVRTQLGRAVRQRARDHGIPWVTCPGSGRASMVRAIGEAIVLSARQAGEA